MIIYFSKLYGCPNIEYIKPIGKHIAEHVIMPKDVHRKLKYSLLTTIESYVKQNCKQLEKYKKSEL